MNLRLGEGGVLLAVGLLIATSAAAWSDDAPSPRAGDRALVFVDVKGLVVVPSFHARPHEPMPAAVVDPPEDDAMRAMLVGIAECVGAEAEITSGGILIARGTPAACRRARVLLNGLANAWPKGLGSPW